MLDNDWTEQAGGRINNISFDRRKRCLEYHGALAQVEDANTLKCGK